MLKLIIYAFSSIYFRIRYGLHYLWRRVQFGRPNRAYTEPNDNDRYDVFISYKSDQSEEIRILAEALLARKVHVWFDEYRINPFKRGHFQEEIDHAIERSALFVYFDTPNYRASEYCQHERNLAQQNAAIWPENVLRIVDVHDSSEPTGLFVEDGISTLRELTAYTYSSPVRKALNAIGEKLGRELSLEFRDFVTFVPGTESTCLQTESHDVKVFAPGWTQLHEASREDGLTKPLVLVKRHQTAKIQCSIRAARIGKADGLAYNTEREKIEAVIDLMREKNRTWQWEIFGLHYLQINKKPHLAASVDAGVDGIFHRYYMVFVGKKRVGSGSDDIYLYFDFYLRGTKEDFFNLAYLFDEVAYSTRWRKIRGRRKKMLWRH